MLVQDAFLSLQRHLASMNTGKHPRLAVSRCPQSGSERQTSYHGASVNRSTAKMDFFGGRRDAGATGT